jgi:hypothetical protein
MSLDASNAKDRYIPTGTHRDITNNKPGNLSVSISLNGGVYTTGKTLKIADVKTSYNNSSSGKINARIAASDLEKIDGSGHKAGGFTADIPVDKIAGVVHGGELNTGSR